MEIALDLARSLLAQPTAPFHEDAVRSEIFQLLAQCPHVMVTQDDFGNVIAHYQCGPARPQFALSAHMDHPGFVGNEFLGSVPETYRQRNPPVRDFGAFSMWDLPPFELRDDRLYSRACDDLIGCAAIVAVFHELERSSAEASVYGLFTRAEEVGFVGALKLAQSGILPRDVVIISLETSSEKAPGCGMGDGVIVRVGDRSSIFAPDVTAMLIELAKSGEIPVQRCLMDRGTCAAAPSASRWGITTIVAPICKLNPSSSASRISTR
ncbi:MAG: M20/M25/M40 family metallo-hydrolase [Chthoniobacteraceae bacterium]